MNIADRFRLDGSVAIVTDANSGFGTPIARALAEVGADIALGTRRDQGVSAAETAVADAGRKAVEVRTDIREPADCQRLVDAARELGPVRVLVNNSTTTSAAPSARESAGQFRSVLDGNLLGAYQMSQAASAVMDADSAIVNISSVLGLVTVGLPQSAYTASKAGLLGLTRDLAAQWSSRKQIRVNAIAPGYFPEELDGASPENHLDWLLSDRPISRAGTGEELAAAVVFLATPASSYITGTTLAVDGGVTIS